jgi:radical SAM superfamily enzyme YgiQ (UPF0313 family)
MIENVTDKFLNMINLPDDTGKKLNYLIVLPTQADMRSQYMFPIGFGIVSSSLKASGRNAYSLNLTYKETPFELLRETIINNEINVVATGGLSGQYALIRNIIDAVKIINPYIITIVGGGIITAEPEVAMKALENADYGIIGEGEITINALAYALETDIDTTTVEGVISKRGEEFISSSPRAYLTDLDCLPFPDYYGFDYTDMFKREYSANSVFNSIGTTILTSRYCPYSCTFCFNSSEKKYRRRSLDNVFKELDWLKSLHSFNHLHINDEMFICDLDYVNEFCERIKPYGLSYSFSARLDIKINNDLLDLLKESGCTQIFFGVEHISDKILESMQKKTKSSMIELVFNQVIEKGIVPSGNIIFGDLEETIETVREALNWWKEHRFFKIKTSHIFTFPGSHIYKIACEKGIIKDPVQFLRDGCPMVNITKMSADEWSAMKDEIVKTTILYEDVNFKPDEEKISGALNLLANNDYKVCVWPAIHESMRFFKVMSKMFYDKAYFININVDSQLLKTCDEKFKRKIYNSDIILKENIEIVICPRINLINEIRTICKNEYPCVKHVISISELETLDF